MIIKHVKISLITVSFNSAHTIGDTIASVREQNYPNLEYIIIDGGSSDGTLTVIKQNSDVIDHAVSEQDDGIYDAMNKGINLASGEVIAFINSDDMLADSTVLQQIAEVLRQEEIDACYADLVYVQQTDRDKVIRYWRSSAFKPGLFGRGWSPPHPTFYVKKSVYEQFGGFSLDYKMGNDIELMLRFLERYQVKSLYVPKTWVKMRIGGVSNQSLGNIILQNKEIIKAAKNNGISFFVPLFVLGKIKDRLIQYLFK